MDVWVVPEVSSDWSQSEVASSTRPLLSQLLYCKHTHSRTK